MKPEHDERFRRIADDYLDRPRGDYAELLRRGEVSSPEGVDPEAWRAEIRAKARADKIRVPDTRLTPRVIDRLRLRAVHTCKIRCTNQKSLPKAPTTERLPKLARLQDLHEVFTFRVLQGFSVACLVSSTG